MVETAARGVSDLRRRYAAPVVMLLAVVSLVLLVACTNVANILLGRGAARRHALSLHVALGASRWRLVRRFLIESALLALLGAVLGIRFAGWAARAMVAQLPSGEVPIVLDLDVDLRVLAYTASVAVAAAVVAGLAPALWATTVHPLDALQAGGRSGSAGGRVRGFGALQVAQVAVSVLLLVAAGLFGRTFQQLTRAPLGFDDDRLLVATVRTPTTPPADQSEVRHRMARAVASIPGVAVAGGSDQAPLYYTYSAFPLSLAGASPLAAPEAWTHMVPITPGWFEAYGMPMRAGRPIEERDAAGAQPAMVVKRRVRGTVLSRSGPAGADGHDDVHVPRRRVHVHPQGGGRHRRQRRARVHPRSGPPHRLRTHGAGAAAVDLRGGDLHRRALGGCHSGASQPQRGGYAGERRPRRAGVVSHRHRHRGLRACTSGAWGGDRPYATPNASAIARRIQSVLASSRRCRWSGAR